MQKPPISLVIAMAVAVYIVESNVAKKPLYKCLIKLAMIAYEYLVANVLTCLVRNFYSESSYTIAAIWISLRLLGESCALYPIIALAPTLWWSANDWRALSKGQNT